MAGYPYWRTSRSVTTRTFVRCTLWRHSTTTGSRSTDSWRNSRQWQHSQCARSHIQPHWWDWLLPRGRCTSCRRGWELRKSCPSSSTSLGGWFPRSCRPPMTAPCTARCCCRPAWRKHDASGRECTCSRRIGDLPLGILKLVGYNEIGPELIGTKGQIADRVTSPLVANFLLCPFW